MNKIQRDLMSACYRRKVLFTYADVQSYACNFKKYDNMRMSEIDEVVDKLSEIEKQEKSRE